MTDLGLNRQWFLREFLTVFNSTTGLTQPESFPCIGHIAREGFYYCPKRGVGFSKPTQWGSQTPDFLGFENPIVSVLRN
jgi:hypothetical protein